VSNVEQAFAEMIAANPIPLDAAPPSQAWTEDDLLGVIDDRDRFEPAQPAASGPERASKRERRIRWLVAAAAFMAVLLTIGVVAAITSFDEGDVADTTAVPPTTPVSSTTEPPPTTQAVTTTATPAPTSTSTTLASVDPADQAAIDTFVAAFNAGNVEATRALLSPDALVWSSLIAGELQEPLSIVEFGSLFDGWMRFNSLQEAQIALDSCAPVDDGRINCRGTLSDVIVVASPSSPAGLSVTFDVGPDGAVSYFFFRPNDAAMNASYGYFNFWLDETYPGDSGVLYNATPIFTDDALALWALRVPEWIASLDG